jgi:hypothetical protein
LKFKPKYENQIFKQVPLPANTIKGGFIILSLDSSFSIQNQKFSLFSVCVAITMELDSSSSLQLNQSNVVDASGNQVSRNNSRGIRVIGNRIYDSENGKSCHQVRVSDYIAY